MIRRIGPVLGLLIALVVLCPLLLAVLPGPWLARQASGMASAWLDLSVHVDEMTVKPFSLTPTVALRSLTISATPDSAGLNASQVTVGLNLPALLKGEAVLDRLLISNAALDGRIDEQGRTNWHTTDAHAFVKPPRLASFLETLRTVKIDDLVLDSFKVKLVNAQLQTRFSLDIKGVASTYDASKWSRVHVTGFADDEPVKLDAEFGFLGDFLKLPATGNAPITMDVTASVGDDNVALNGTIGNPASMSEVDAVFSVQISSLEHWQAFIPIAFPDIPSLAFAGVLTRERAHWLLRLDDGQIGNTDFSGEVRAAPSRQPLVLDASLTSVKLDFDEFKSLAEIAFKPIPVHGKIDYRAEQVVSDKWPLDTIDLSAELNDRRLSVLINRIDLGDGELDGEIVRDLQSQPVVTQIRLMLKRLDLQQLLPANTDDSLRAGQMTARVQLNVTGRTRSSMRGSVDGVVLTLMTGDWLDTVLQSALGVELAETLMVERGAPEKREQNCAFIELQATEGIVQLRSLVFDTDTIVYLGDGEFDWQNQSIDLTIEPHHKNTAAVAHADAIYISGPLTAPEVESVHPFLTRDSAVSVLDATIAPAVTLMPFLNQYSDGSDVLCQGLASALDGPQ